MKPDRPYDSVQSNLLGLHDALRLLASVRDNVGSGDELFVRLETLAEHRDPVRVRAFCRTLLKELQKALEKSACV